MFDIYPSQKQRGEGWALLGIKFSLCFGSKATPNITALPELDELQNTHAHPTWFDLFLKEQRDFLVPVAHQTT